jgi:hypothetical protein
LIWRVVNYEEPGNEHYADTYELATQSLIIVSTHDGSETDWKNLGKVWELLGDKDAFLNYVHDEISSYLDEV